VHEEMNFSRCSIFSSAES